MTDGLFTGDVIKAAAMEITNENLEDYQDADRLRRQKNEHAISTPFTNWNNKAQGGYRRPYVDS